jgi:hypothetical protein
LLALACASASAQTVPAAGTTVGASVAGQGAPSSNLAATPLGPASGNVSPFYAVSAAGVGTAAAPGNPSNGPGTGMLTSQTGPSVVPPLNVTSACVVQACQPGTARAVVPSSGGGGGGAAAGGGPSASTFINAPFEAPGAMP